MTGEGEQGWLAAVISRYVWTPGVPPALGVGAVVLCLAVLVFAARSVVWWTTTGPVNDSERKWFNKPSGLYRSVLAGLTAIGFLYPFALAVATALLVFQVSGATVVLLISRENQVLALSADWRRAVAEANRDRRWVDAGKVVDRALQLFAARHPGAAQSQDAAARNAARQAAVDAVREHAADDFVGDEVPSPDQVTLGKTDSRVQSWAVESIEWAVLRLIAERVNLSRLLVQTGGRRDAAGLPTWQFADTYLRPETRFIGRSVVRVIDGGPSARLRLISADALGLMPDGRQDVMLTFYSPAAPGRPAAKVTIMPDGGVVTVPQSAVGSVVRLPVALAASAVQVEARYSDANPPDVVPLSSAADRWPSKTIRVVGPDVWRQTVEGIITPPNPTPGDPSAGWWLRLVNRRLFDKGGLLPAGTKLVFGGEPVSGEIVIDGRSDPAVHMYYASDTDPRAVPRAKPTESAGKPIALWMTRVAADRVFGLANLELPPKSLTEVDEPSFVEGYGATTEGWRLNDGPLPRRPGVDHPVLAVLPDLREPTRRSVVWFGMKPREVELIAGIRGRWENEMSAAAFWSGMFDAAQLCPHPVAAGPKIPDDGQRPVVLLTSDDIRQAAVERYTAGTTVVAAALAAAAIWSLCQLWMTRNSS